jgi:hypothetical protein
MKPNNVTRFLDAKQIKYSIYESASKNYNVIEANIVKITNAAAAKIAR